MARISHQGECPDQHTRSAGSPRVLELHHLVKLATEAVKQDLLASGLDLVKNGFDYAANWDASTKADSISGYKQAFDILNKGQRSSKVGSAAAEAGSDEPAAVAVKDIILQQHDVVTVELQ